MQLILTKIYSMYLTLNSGPALGMFEVSAEQGRRFYGAAVFQTALLTGLFSTTLQIYHENVLLMENKYTYCFIVRQSYRLKFMPKMRENMFGGRAPAGRTGGSEALVQTH